MKKSLLLVFSLTLMLLFTSNAFAQQGTVRVANNAELIQALDDASVSFIEITQDGFYDAILMDATNGTVITKNGERDVNACTLSITKTNKCWVSATDINFASAATSGEPECPSQPTSGATLGWSSPDSEVTFDFSTNFDQWDYNCEFTTTGPGDFTIKYTWDVIGNEAQAVVFLWGAGEITELSATDDSICGTDFEITFDYDMDPTSPDTTVTWTLDGAPITGPTLPGTWTLTVPDCGDYNLEMALTNSLGCGVDTEDIDLVALATPVADAGNDGHSCGFTYTLNGSATVGCGATATMEWSAAAGNPGTSTFNGNDVTVTACGEYFYVFTASNGDCIDTDTVEINFVDEPIVEAGDDFSTCGDWVYIPATDTTEYRGYGVLDGSFTANCLGDDVNVGWSVWDGPAGASVTYVQSQDTLTTDIVVNMCGTYKFLLQVWNGPVGSACESTDTVTYMFYDIPVVIAGDDSTVCGLDFTFTPSYTLECDNGNTATTEWSQLSGPGTGTFTDDDVLVDECGTYEFIYTVTNTECIGSDTVMIEFFDTPDVDAGIDVDICGIWVTPPNYLGLATLVGDYEASCTGTIDPTYLWTYDGPGTITYIQGDDVDSTDIEADMCGIYTFVLHVYTGGDDSICAATDTTVYWFYDMPDIYAGPDSSYCGLTANIDPTVATWSVVCDNGNPVTESWTIFTGPGNMVYTDSTITVDECGTYNFIYSVTNTACTALDTVSIDFFETPIVEAGDDQDICGLVANIEGTYTLDCGSGATTVWTMVSGPGGVTYDPDTLTAAVEITVDICGIYVFEFGVENGVCSAADQVTINFFDTPVITMIDVPERVCGFVAPPFGASFTVSCDIDGNAAASWTASAGATIVEQQGLWVASVTDCGTYDFTYEVINGPCSIDSIISITFYADPEPSIIGPDTILACSTAEYCATDLSCNDDALMTFVWTVSGGVFSDGSTTITSTCVDVDWDNDYNSLGSLLVFASIDTLGCMEETQIDVVKLAPTIAGQVKYWNDTETYMPSPFPNECTCPYPEDYFYVTLFSGDPNGMHSEWDTDIVEPELTENLEEYMSYYNFDLPVLVTGCDVEFYVEIWDGGLTYHTTPPPPASETVLGHNYTYNNWGGVNATDALAIQLMAANEEINSTPWNYTWVGDQALDPAYGYYSFAVTDVNSSFAVTALDALTANYRAVGLLASYPNSGANQFNPNFRVTGRMVDGVDVITFPLPFDTAANATDVPFAHSGTDYMFFSLAIDHAYRSEYIPWKDDNQFMNIYYEAIGDINASYVPTSGGFKAQSNVSLTYEGTMSSYIGEEMTIPVSIDRDAELGAISLFFSYNNELIEVIGTNYESDYVFINNEEGILNIGWFSEDGIDIAAEENIAQIRIRVLSDLPAGTELFSLNANTELADLTANPIEIELKTIGVNTTGVSDFTDLTANNYPNPFNDVTTISYTLPENGTVKVDVFNNAGMLVKTLVEEYQESGVQNIEFSANEVNSGIYFYHITVRGETKTYSAVKRMIVMH